MHTSPLLRAPQHYTGLVLSIPTPFSFGVGDGGEEALGGLEMWAPIASRSRPPSLLSSIHYGYYSLHIQLFWSHQRPTNGRLDNQVVNLVHTYFFASTHDDATGARV